MLLAKIEEQEKLLPTDGPKAAQQLITLYNKAVEYYSALNDDKFMTYLQKLQKLMTDEKL